MLQRHAAQVLLGADHTQIEVARLTGISERSVRRISREPKVTTIDDAAVCKGRRVGRPAKAQPFLPLIRALLKARPDLQGKEIIRRMRLEGYTGGSTAAYDLIKKLRVRARRFVMRFEALAGEFTQHDFGEVWVTFTDGGRQKVKFFATQLRYSRWVEVAIVPDQKAETLVRTLVAHFERIGGIPLLAIFDRPKTIALSWQKDGKVTEWNKTFATVMFELGLGVELCWPYSPEQKGGVEQVVGWVKSSFFKQREFVDAEDLQGQLAEWLWEVNRVRVSRATGVRPLDRMPAEQARLRSLRVTPAFWTRSAKFAAPLLAFAPQLTAHSDMYSTSKTSC